MKKQSNPIIEEGLKQKVDFLMANTDENLMMVNNSALICAYSKAASVFFRDHWGVKLSSGILALDVAPFTQFPAFKQALDEALKGNKQEIDVEPGSSSSLDIALHIKYWPAFDDSNEIAGVFISLGITQSGADTTYLADNVYQITIDSSPIPMFLGNPDGSLLYANKAASETFGYSSDEFHHLNRLDILDTSDPRLSAFIQTRDVKGRLFGELTGIRKNGERFPCEVSSALFTLPSGELKSSNTIIDISERKKLENEMSLLVNNTDESFVLLNTQLEIVNFNKQFKDRYLQLLGREVKKGDNILDYSPPGRRAIVGEIYRKVLAGATESSEYSLPISNDSSRHFAVRYKPALDDKNVIFGVFVTISDITKSKQAQEQMLAHEYKYKVLIENNSDAVVILNPEDTKPKFVSESITRILGYTVEEAMQLDVFGLMHPDDIDGAMKAVEDCLKNPGKISPAYVSRLRHKDGSWRWCDGSLANFVDDPAIGGIIDNFRDVTDKVKAEQELKETTYFLEKAQEVGNVGHWISDLNIDDGKLVWSKQTFRIFGIKDEDFDGKTGSFFKLVHPDDLKQVKEVTKLAYKGNTPYNIQHRVFARDGSIRWVEQQAEVTRDEKGKPLLMIGVVRDITEQVERDKELTQRTEFIEAAINHLPIGVLVTSMSDGKAVLKNNNFHAIYGWPAHELDDMPSFLEKIYPNAAYRKKILDQVREDLQSGDQERMDWEGLEITTKDGEKRVTNVKSIPLPDQSLMISTVMDVTSEKVAQKALLQSEEKYRSLFHNSPLPQWIFDLKTLKFLEVNQAAIDHYGYTREEFVQMKITQLKLKAELHRMKRMTAVADKSKKIDFGEWTHFKKNGDTIITEITGHYVNYQGSEAMMIIANDITASIKIQEELRESNERFLFAARATSDAIWDWNLVEETVRWGEGFETIFGYDLKTLKTDVSSWTDHIHPEDLEAVTKSIYEVIGSGETNWEKEYRYLRADDSFAFVADRGFVIRDDKGNAIRMVGAMHDVTQQKEEENRLKLLESVITTTNDAVIITETTKTSGIGRKIIYVNEAFTKMTGYTADDVKGKSPKILQGPKSDQLELKRLDLAIKNSESCTISTINYKKNGEEYWVSVSLSPVADNKGIITHWIAIERDISEAKRSQQRLQEANRKVSNTLESIQDGFFSLNTNWRITYWNKEAEKILNKKREEIVGNNFWEVFPETKSMKFFNDSHTAMKKSISIRFEEYFSPLQIWLEGSAFPSEDGLTIYFKDITDRKKAEIDLLKFKNVIKNSRDGVGILDNHGNTIYLNPAFSEILGYTVESLEKGIGPRSTYSDKKLAEEVFGTLLAGNYWKGDVQLINAKGEILDFYLSAGPIVDDQGHLIAIYGIHTDISGRKKAEKALQDAYFEKNTILESIGDGFFTIDKNWIVTYWNNQAEKLLGLPRNIILDQNIWEIFVDNINSLSFKEFHRALEINEAIHFEDYYGPINKWFEISVYPSSLGLSVYFKDITEKRLAEEQIRVAKERYDMVALVAKDAIYDWDIVEEKIQWGDGFEKLFGYTKNETIDSVNAFSKIVHPEDEPEDDKRLQRVLSSPSAATWESEFRLRKKDGSYANVLERGYIIRNEHGKAIRMIGSLQDMTERKQYEIKLTDLNRQLLQRAEELAASNLELERFAYVASHDLQEPLRMITSFLQLLERRFGEKLDKKSKEYIFYAVDGANRMKSLILDLLEYSRVNTLDEEYTDVDLNQVGKSILETFKTDIIELNAQIKIQKLPTVWGNKQQLLRLFQNLISNAIKYRMRDTDPIIEISGSSDKNNWIFAIKDNGIGIDKAYFDKIFIIFQRLHNKSEFSGTGIGLAICKKIVEKHKGNIWVDSEIGKGSTFHISIPKKD
ncbi:MAG: PAS domain S-box protein [Imperialibacter sp.]|uniref:PAS domain S-box protein n=1 Tax=Imperialibacter sp. TaxID=2038411 RepID=UPI003A85F229